MKCDLNSTLFPRLSGLSLLTLGLCINVAVEATAQSSLIPDQTLGTESSQVQRQLWPTPTDLITGGARRGQNLFHSFQDFNVGAGESVFFQNPNGVNNILTRVTGGSVSNIDSVLGVLGNANLFFMNPHGIIFGPNASLDLGGSFVATTANAIQFNAQDSFSATAPQTSSLLSIQPSAFFFNQTNSGQITNRSQSPFGDIGAASTGVSQIGGLGVPEGESLLLVGGNINLDGGGVNAIFGRVDIASVQAGQTLEIDTTKSDLALQSLPPTQAGTITTNRASVNNGSTATPTVDARRGLIRFQGKNLVLTDSSIFNVIPNVSASVDETNTGIVLTAQNIVLDNTRFTIAARSSFGQSGNIFIEADQVKANKSSLSIGAAALGTKGNIMINVKDLFTLENSRFDTESATNFPDQGLSGDIEIQAGELIARHSDLSTSTAGLENAGNIFIDVRNKVLLENTQISSESNPVSAIISNVVVGGDAGNIEIKANELLSLDSQFSTATSTQGNAGDIKFNITDQLQINESAILSTSSDMGNAGNIELAPNQLTVKSSFISTGTSGQGNAGDITLNVRDKILFDSSQLFSNVAESAMGDAGTIRINAGQFTTQGSPVISSRTRGQGNAGNVIFDIDGTILFDNLDIFTSVEESATGNGGNIEISAQEFTAQDLLFLSANTSGQGNAGNITFKIKGKVQLDGFVQITSEVRGEGRGEGGDISITAGQYMGQNRAFLSTRTSGQGNAGNVIFNVAEDIQLNNSDIFSDALNGAVGNAGNIEIEARRLTARNNSALRSETFGIGNAGNVNIQTRESINFNGAVEGRVSQFPTGVLTNVGSDAVGKGGNINIQTQQLNITNGAEISAETFGTGIGGNINIMTTEGLELRGMGSQLSVASVEQAMGAAGSLNIEADSLTVADGAQVTVSAPQSRSGTLSIQANSLELDRGTLSAETGESGLAGANIDLQISQFLTLENESLISANALDGANGGNIVINSPLLVALSPIGPNGSDIIANAIDGQGGAIGITTQGLFGITPRNVLTPLNDITASSSTSLPGEVSIQTTEVDPSDNLSNLPIRSPEVKIVKTCAAQQDRSDFVVLGRGGLPPSPQESLEQDAFQVGLVTLDTPSPLPPNHHNQATQNRSTVLSSSSPSSQKVSEAQGWTINPAGQVILSASINPSGISSPPLKCHG